MKLFIMGVIATFISGLTGIPICPFSPVIENNKLDIKINKVDEKKLSEFKAYAASKF